VCSAKWYNAYVLCLEPSADEAAKDKAMREYRLAETIAEAQ
jgi:hypothetical protein